MHTESLSKTARGDLMIVKSKVAVDKINCINFQSQKVNENTCNKREDQFFLAQHVL